LVMQESVQSDCDTEKVIENRVGIARTHAVASFVERADEIVVRQHERKIQREQHFTEKLKFR
jgi:hypothetical protein